MLNNIDDSDFSMARRDSIRALTNVFVLHPVSAALLLISFLLSLFAGSFCGSLIAMFFSAITFIVSIVAVAVDFAVFSLVLQQVRKADGQGGRYATAIWLALAAAILTLIATLILAATCCVGKRRRAHAKRDKLEAQTHPQAY